VIQWWILSNCEKESKNHMMLTSCSCSDERTILSRYCCRLIFGLVLREEPYRYCFHLFDFLCQQMLYMMSRCCNLNVLNKFLNKICTFIWFIFSIISRTNRFNKTFFIMTFNTIWSKSIMPTPKFFVYIYCTWFFS